MTALPAALRTGPISSLEIHDIPDVENAALAESQVDQ
jgi:hypothetical protein